MTVDDIVTGMPYARFLGIETSHEAAGLITRMPFRQQLVGNPVLPALHGGVVGAFLEMAAIIEVIHQTRGERVPRPINFNVNYLRTAEAANCMARAEVVKLGKRVIHVWVIGWQEEPSRPFASGYGHFLT
jgi:uncharacterized protein (TIGR00369 family)